MAKTRRCRKVFIFCLKDFIYLFFNTFLPANGRRFLNENLHLDSKCKINGQSDADDLINTLRSVLQSVIMYNAPFALGHLPPWSAVVILFSNKFKPY